ncbi:MAG: hypothetical protein AVDCRST_MAG76-431, partial [uncultured Acidimicrobiales bacterium]
EAQEGMDRPGLLHRQPAGASTAPPAAAAAGHPGQPAAGSRDEGQGAGPAAAEAV